ncbi:MAG: cyclin family protein [Acidobacteriaceae bacterium]|nr:cyclin family protein [Acidobacteriaceae bacterium]
MAAQAGVETKLREFYARTQAELESKLPEPDKRDINKLYNCAEYAGGIYTYLCEREKMTAAKHGYMKNQTELNEKMRAVLMDWICAVGEKFTLQSETLFLAANVVDRYLDCERITKSRLQLLGATAMVIASKYEEIYPPEIRDFIHVTEKAISKDEILKLEGQILQKLKFELSGPSVLRFMERYAKLAGCSEQGTHLAQFMCELQLLDYGMLRHLPSLVAAGAVYLSQKMVKGASGWSDYLREQSGHNEEEVKACAKELLAFAQSVTLQATKKKYSQRKYLEVAKLHLDGVSL